MTRRLLAIAGALIIALAATLPLVGAQTAPEITPLPTRSILLVNDAFIRSGPSETFVAVGRVLPGAPLSALNRSEDGRWVMIRYNRGFGWIRRDLVLWAVDVDALPVLTGDLTPTPIPGEPTATLFLPTSTPTGDYVRVSATSAYLRGGPGVTYLRLGQLFPGDPLEPIGRNEDSSWVLIRTVDGFAWLRRDLGNWVSDLDTLPVLLESRLTPSLTYTPSNTATATATATDTPLPSDTPTDTPTSTATASATATETASVTLTPTWTATVTATNTAVPSETAPPLPSATATVTVEPPVEATATSEPQATDTAAPEPTATETPAPTATNTEIATDTPTFEPTAEPTATNTDAPTATPTDIPTATATATPEPTATDTDQPTATDTEVATDIPTSEPTATNTDAPTATATGRPTDEPTPAETQDSAQAVASATNEPATSQPTDTATVAATATPEPSSTDTAEPEPTATETATAEPSATDTAAPTETATEQPTIEASTTVTLAPLPSETAEAPAADPSATDAAELTAIAAVITVTAAPPTDSPAVSPTLAPTVPDSGQGGVRPELLAAGTLLLLILGYVGLYLRGAATGGKYATGFVIEECPVCREGRLTVEAKTERSLGIPSTKHVVRCNHCRSVLRESGGGRWRYAVDRSANPQLYDRLNNREIREDTLKRLLDTPFDGGGTRITPEIVDDEPKS